MERYIDGFVIPIPKERIEEYRRIAETAGALWIEHGALEYWECLGDDLAVKDIVPFPRAVQAGDDETVCFSWIVYASREHRDKVNAAVMADPRMKEMMDTANGVFDCGRIVYGGFRQLVRL